MSSKLIPFNTAFDISIDPVPWNEEMSDPFDDDEWDDFDDDEWWDDDES